MNNTITISWNELQQQIDLRNFYMGESVKRKDIDADTIQSSKDDEELMRMFAHSACNQLITAVAVRFPTISYDIKKEYIAFNYKHDSSNRTPATNVETGHNRLHCKRNKYAVAVT